jgi:hypothetical protein
MTKSRDTAIMSALSAKVRSITNGTTKARSSSSRPPASIDATLRQFIKRSRMTHYAIGKAAGVQASQIDRFMMPADDPRHRDLRLATAAKIAAALGLVLSETW